MSSLFARTGWVLAAALGLLVVAAISGVVRAGPLDPPGTPGPTQPQVEPRSPIPPVGWNGSFPIVIAQPGSYFLTRDLAPSAAVTAIQIAASDVSVDLNGFTLRATVNPVSDTAGIEVTGVRNNLTVRNGRLTGGWSFGVWAAKNSMNYAGRSRFEDLQVSGTWNSGLQVAAGAHVRNVQAVNNNDTGIEIVDPGSTYEGGLIEDCVAARNGGSGIAIHANNVTVRHCVIDSNYYAGVVVTGAFDVIIDNTVQGTNQGPGILLTVDADVATVARNVFANLAGGAVSDQGFSNLVGVLDSSLSSSRPWSNAYHGP